MARTLFCLALSTFLIGCGGKDDSAAPVPPGETDDTDIGVNSGETDDTNDTNVDTDDTDDGGPGQPFSFHLVDGTTIGPHNATVADITGDGKMEILVSAHGPVQQKKQFPGGIVRMYTWNGGKLDAWSSIDIMAEAEGVLFPNKPKAHDVDGDGDLDVIVPMGSPWCTPQLPQGYCGGLRWYEQAANGWVAHIVASGLDVYYDTVELIDFDGDGILDILTAGQQVVDFEWVAQTLWYRGTGSGFENGFHIIGNGGGTWLTPHDIDQDGDLDIAFGNVAQDRFSWFQQLAAPDAVNPDGVWQRHMIDTSRGPGFMMRFVDDLYGDGAMIVVATNHTNTQRLKPYNDPWESQVIGYTIPGDPTEPWSGVTLSEGIAAMQDLPIYLMNAPGEVVANDLDSDGDLDLIVAGDGDPTLYLMRQNKPGEFEMRVLYGPITRPTGLSVVDMDGDGDDDIVVTGEAQNVLYVIEQL